jgi:hypothetical protein
VGFCAKIAISEQLYLETGTYFFKISSACGIKTKKVIIAR